MRQVFLEVKTATEAADKAPWAAVIIEVTGGYRAFESVIDFEIWYSQD